jgi:tetratricopeptide (TPR) repeat protein/TolB-like protein/DNA-binding winged helix-turn-helix (wHTH) protein
MSTQIQAQTGAATLPSDILMSRRRKGVRMQQSLLKGFYLQDLLIEPTSGRVSGPGVEAHLKPKAVEVLLQLAQRPFELVERDELLRAVWGENAGSPDALTHTISELRSCCKDHADSPSLIQTVPRRGYRLLQKPRPVDETGPVTDTGVFQVPDDGSFVGNLMRRGVVQAGAAYMVFSWLLIQVADAVTPTLNLPAWFPSVITYAAIGGFPIVLVLAWMLERSEGRWLLDSGKQSGKMLSGLERNYLSILMAYGIAVIGAYAYQAIVGFDLPETTSVASADEESLMPVRPNSIAVLPFLNVDGSEQTQIIANGLVDDVITSLARVPGLLVSSRGDAFTLDPNTASARVRERLRVALYLEGSVQIEGDTMRVILQLIDTETGFHVLSRSIDRPVASFLEMRKEVTDLTVANVRVSLPDETQLLPAFDLEASDLNAYVLYRRGKEIFEQPRTLDSLSQVIAYYKEALSLDPDYAAAHAGLCATYVVRYEISNATVDIDRAEDACALALNSNPQLHMVYSALGDLYTRTARITEADTAYRKALEINPQDAQAMSGKANVYQREQRYDEAEQLFRQAIEIQPGSWRAIESYGTFLFTIGRYDEAAVAYRQGVQLDSENWEAWVNLGSALAMAGDIESASLAYEESLKIKKSETAHSNLGVIYYYLGEFEKSVAEHRAAVALNPGQAVKWLNLADALYFAGETAEARVAFSKASELAESRLRVDSDDFFTMIMLGWTQQMLGNAAGAEEYIEKGLSIAPNDPYGLYYRALVEVQAGDHDAALRALQSAVDNGYPAKVLAVEPYLEDLKQNPKFRNLISASN